MRSCHEMHKVHNRGQLTSHAGPESAGQEWIWSIAIQLVDKDHTWYLVAAQVAMMSKGIWKVQQEYVILVLKILIGFCLMTCCNIITIITTTSDYPQAYQLSPSTIIINMV